MPNFAKTVLRPLQGAHTAYFCLEVLLCKSGLKDIYNKLCPNHCNLTGKVRIRTVDLAKGGRGLERFRVSQVKASHSGREQVPVCFAKSLRGEVQFASCLFCACLSHARVHYAVQAQVYYARRHAYASVCTCSKASTSELAISVLKLRRSKQLFMLGVRAHYISLKG